MNRGEVWWYEPPDEKSRPVCILTRQAAIPLLERILAAPATTRIRGGPTEVRLDREHGMPQECVLAFDDLRLVRKSLLTRRLTVLREPKLSALCEAMRIAAGCPPD